MGFASSASAGVVILDNNITGPGALEVDADDFGSYGREFAPTSADRFWPVGAPREEAQTFMAASFLFISLPIQSAVMLSSYQLAYNKVEPTPPNAGDGIKPDTISRTVTMANAATAAGSHSEFLISDQAGMVKLEIKLDQRLVVVNPTSSTRLEQDYLITNTAGVAATLAFHTFWDMDLFFTGNSVLDDVIGAGTGICYVYQHEPGNPAQGGSLSDGGSTTPASYYAAKAGVSPDGGPPYTTADSTMQPAWDLLGMPAGWRNHVAHVGYDMAGVTTQNGDAMLGLEWRFTLQPGASHTIKVRRHYGTNALPCNVSATCGNGVVDGSESCETNGGPDTATCNAATCTAPVCGDGYVNAAAGEACESAGVDSVDCVGTTCRASVCGDRHVNAAAGEACDDGEEDTAACNAENCQPASCGDGIVNVAANESCEAGELCDLATCSYAYTVGGGCAGCSGGDGGSWLAGLTAVVLLRRRRARRPATRR